MQIGGGGVTYRKPLTKSNVINSHSNKLGWFPNHLKSERYEIII